MKVARGLKVCWLALRLYLDFRKTKSKAKALKRDLGLDDKDPESDWNEDIVALWHEANLRSANLVYDQICNLRGLWVKAGQFISSRPDIVAPEYVQVLSKLQDAIPARPWEEVEATLVKELGGDWNEKHFKSVDTEPLSTASIAQVHRAVMHDGAQVVVKVAHSGIRSQMLSDLRILSYLVRVLAVLEKDQDYRKIVQEWSPAVTSEIDLRNESENMERVRNSMIKGGVEVEIPKPVMSTSSVLVMNFLEGFSPKNKEMLESSGVDRRSSCSVCVSVSPSRYTGMDSTTLILTPEISSWVRIPSPCSWISDSARNSRHLRRLPSASSCIPVTARTWGSFRKRLWKWVF